MSKRPEPGTPSATTTAVATPATTSPVPSPRSAASVDAAGEPRRSRCRAELQHHTPATARHVVGKQPGDEAGAVDDRPRATRTAQAQGRHCHAPISVDTPRATRGSPQRSTPAANHHRVLRPSAPSVTTEPGGAPRRQRGCQQASRQVLALRICHLERVEHRGGAHQSHQRVPDTGQRRSIVRLPAGANSESPRSGLHLSRPRRADSGVAGRLVRGADRGRSRRRRPPPDVQRRRASRGDHRASDHRTDDGPDTVGQDRGGACLDELGRERGQPGQDPCRFAFMNADATDATPSRTTRSASPPPADAVTAIEQVNHGNADGGRLSV